MDVNIENIMDEIRAQIVQEQAQSVDIKEIMREIRAQIQAEGSKEQVPPFHAHVVGQNVEKPQSGSDDWEQFMQNLRYVNLNYDIPYYWSFGPSGLKTFVKRIIRKLLKCLIPPILARQNEFNAHTVRCLNTMRYFIEEQRAENQKMKDLQEQQCAENQKMKDLQEQQRAEMQKMKDLQEQLFTEIALLSEKMEDMSESMQANVDELNEAISGVNASLKKETEEKQAQLLDLQQQTTLVEQKLHDLEQRTERAEAHLRSLQNHADLSDKQSDAFSSNVARTILKYAEKQQNHSAVQETTQSESQNGRQEQNAYQELDYFKFQNAFRGTRALIKERQKMYVPYFKNQKESVLDIGCGRGEFLQLMRENGIAALGVDLYPEYVVEGELNDLDVRQGDGIEYLEQAGQTFGGIFVGQVIEHISFEQLVHLCRLAYQKLDPGAFLIMETPNPMSLSIFTSSFYIDPTHNKPVHPLTLEYVLREVGFTDVQTVYTDCSRPEQLPMIEGDGIKNLEEVNRAIGRVSDMLYGSQDYAVIAKK